MLRPPFLSDYDPSVEAEGSIDPLGLLPFYERLADRILPAVTVRMGRPRFVTVMAVTARVCSDWDGDALAADGITAPWLVLEWYVIEAFVRNRERLKEQYGIPGMQKVARGLRDHRFVSASNYLKTPTVFGFSGVFRRLARYLRVLTEDLRLDDAGYELVDAWSRDQGLSGFLDARSGPGADFRERLRRAVQQGMRKGHTAHQPGEFWQEITERFDPARAGRNERRVLLDFIAQRSGNPEDVRWIIDALKAAKPPFTYFEEPGFLRRLARKVPQELRERLTAIDAYETFCRPITDAFDWVRHLSTAAHGGPVGPDEFSGVPAAAALVQATTTNLRRAAEHAHLLEWEPEIGAMLARFEYVNDARDLFNSVILHHKTVQREKPPDGKRAWLEEARAGAYAVRPAYTVPEPPEARSPYVHEYRMPTFHGFLKDLGALT